MTTPSSPAHSAAWIYWYRRALPAYWIFLFCATHLPDMGFGPPFPNSDKVKHVVAFGLLAFLFWRFAETFRPLSSRFAWIAGVGLVLYAALDEYLQQFVGRNSDLLDWLCDLGGIAAVLAVLEWRRRRVRTL